MLVKDIGNHFDSKLVALLEQCNNISAFNINASSGKIDVEIELSQVEYSPPIVRVLLKNVSNINIKNFNWPLYNDGLSIEDISSSGMEECNWEFSDYEEGKLKAIAEELIVEKIEER